MAGLSLLTLLDDIASVLDDVATMTKVAAQKTAGVLGDDLALNAEQVSGVSADRELPVIWQVAKGSFRNKVILVPAAIIISATLPWLITPLLLIGGLFLCFEGYEKVIHSFQHKNEEQETQIQPDIGNMSVDEYEKSKIKGAIRTDFILSAEIIVIALGTVQQQTLTTQILVISIIALVMTIGVYGLVAAIVRMDDVGLDLVKKHSSGLRNKLGQGLLSFAPKLMHSLATIGTVAMFLVGGSIVVHSIPPLHHLIIATQQMLPSIWQDESSLVWIYTVLMDALAGILAGLIVFSTVTLVQKARGQ